MDKEQILHEIAHLSASEKFDIVQETIRHLKYDARKKNITDREKAYKKLVRHIEKLKFKLPADFKFNREEANARR